MIVEKLMHEKLNGTFYKMSDFKVVQYTRITVDKQSFLQKKIGTSEMTEIEHNLIRVGVTCRWRTAARQVEKLFSV